MSRKYISYNGRFQYKKEFNINFTRKSETSTKYEEIGKYSKSEIITNIGIQFRYKLQSYKSGVTKFQYIVIKNKITLKLFMMVNFIR